MKGGNYGEKMTFNYFTVLKLISSASTAYQKHYLQTVTLKIYQAMLKFIWTDVGSNVSFHQESVV